MMTNYQTHGFLADTWVDGEYDMGDLSCHQFGRHKICPTRDMATITFNRGGLVRLR